MLGAPAPESRALPARQSTIEVGRKGADATLATDAPQEITNALTSQGSPLDTHTRALFESRVCCHHLPASSDALSFRIR